MCKLHFTIPEILFAAEFGNHDHERHTAEYLKDFVVFPQVSNYKKKSY